MHCLLCEGKNAEKIGLKVNNAIRKEKLETVERRSRKKSIKYNTTLQIRHTFLLPTRVGDSAQRENNILNN